MRAAAILGLGSSVNDLKPFQTDAGTEWIIGLPAEPSAADVVLIFGGDGTIHRHLSQLVKLGLPVLVVPAGSGNDFSRALGMRKVRDSLAAWRRFVSSGSNVKNIDLGTITHLPIKPPSPDGSFQQPVLGTRYFSCMAGCGLDGEISRLANALPRWLRAHGGYALSLPAALRGFMSFPTTLLLAEPATPAAFAPYKSGPTVLVICANTPVYGGGMKVAPRARMDDGKLDICRVGDLSRFKLFCLFPTVYFGRHLGMKDVEYFQAERLRLETETPHSIYADGEYVCQTPAEIGVAPSAMRVIVP
jgi:diacylglycerol kinase (ATP)